MTSSISGGRPISDSAVELRRGAVIELVIERPAFGGDVLGYAPDGRVVFVRGAAPGDRVRVRLTRVKKRFARSVLLDVLDAPRRAETFCPHLDTCGGCPWQRVPVPAQRAALSAHLGRTLSQATGASVAPAPIHGPTETMGWRSTARVHWRQGALGFFGAGGQTVVDIDHCPVFSPTLAALYTAVRRQLAPQLKGSGTLRLSASPSAESGTVSLTLPPADGASMAAVERFVASADACHGAVVGQGGARTVFGRDHNVFGAAHVGHPAESFVQAHQPGNAALAAEVVDRLADAKAVIELYAGSGNLSLALAEAGVSVTAVEIDPAAAAALNQTAMDRGLAGRLRAIAGDAGDLPPGPFDCALIDPPRSGAADALEGLCCTGVTRLLYVSCDAATLGRDVRDLVARGWRVEHARAYDLFPHTGHVEALVELRR